MNGADAVAQAGAALLLVGADGRVIASDGWSDAFDTAPPKALDPSDGDAGPVARGLAEVAAEARRRRSPIRRLLPVTLDRVRLYAVSAGPAGGAVALVAMDCTDGLEASPQEGDAIRQLAHDLKAPLTSLSGAVEMLTSERVGRPNPQQARLIGLLGQGVERMLRMIDAAAEPYRAAARARAAREG